MSLSRGLYLTNIVEQDHRAMNRPNNASLGFRRQGYVVHVLLPCWLGIDFLPKFMRNQGRALAGIYDDAPCVISPRYQAPDVLSQGYHSRLKLRTSTFLRLATAMKDWSICPGKPYVT